MTRGKNIRIYVSPNGVRHAELWGWTGQAVAAPRSNIEALKDWKSQLSRPGVYVLLGADESAPKAYIGESDDILVRLKAHVAQKDFWTEIIAFTSKDDHLTKAHVEYLEHRVIRLATDAHRFTLDNGNAPNAPALPRGEIEGLEDFVDNLRVLLLVLGSRLLEPRQVNPSPNSVPSDVIEPSDLFTLNVKGVTANGRRHPEGFYVSKGSGASAEPAQAFPAGYAKLRKSIIDQGIIAADPSDSSKLIFVDDFVFTSPSAAACVVAASSRNGRDVWISKDGRSLGKIEDDEIGSVV